VSPLTSRHVLVLITLLLSIVSLVIEQEAPSAGPVLLFTNILDFGVLALFLAEFALEVARAGGRLRFLRRHLFDVLFLLVFAALFAVNKYLLFSRQAALYGNLPGKIIVVRNIFVVLKVFGRVRRLNAFLRSLTAQPARTVMLSFALAIVTGTVLLMLPFTTPNSRGLGFVDALFTSTSAVCVTGLIVVDTVTAFSIWGKIALMVLIQAGGLGIMILSFFMAFVLRRSLTVEDKLLISYVTSQKDMSSLGRSLRSIVYITLAVEGAGALLLFAGFQSRLGFSLQTVFTSLFHAVSAFCNAGFSLFSDSLEGFRSSLLINLVIGLLIVVGGLSFPVLMDAGSRIPRGLARASGRTRSARRGLSINTRVVLTGTVLLLVAGTLLIYGLEYRHALAGYDLKTQYLAAFFQSLTTRTAGFNSVPMSGLRTPTYLVMMVLMFIGAASGSTAGGIKINSAALILAYVKSVLKDQQAVTLYGHSVSKDLVLRALMILLFGLLSVLTGTLLLSFTEKVPFVFVCFETVSAFGTVGLSAGITPGLSIAGKYVIIVLMFVGRVGPLTLLAAAVQRVRKVQIEYPAGEILIG
jgi:trk system potassium uptake protein TrkH